MTLAFAMYSYINHYFFLAQIYKVYLHVYYLRNHIVMKIPVFTVIKGCRTTPIHVYVV